MIEVNYLAVLIAAVVSMVLGFLWYGPLLGKPWMKEKGYTEESLKEEQSKMGMLYGVSFVLALLTAYVLSHVMMLSQNTFEYTMVMTGVTSAFFMWIGFVLPVQTTNTIFGEQNWKLLAIDTGYQLCSVLAMGLVLGYMG